MKFDSFECSANTSTLYRRRPILTRPAAAAADGYAYVESWWPFEDGTPTAAEVRGFSRAHAEAGVQLAMINLDAGNYARGDRGLLSVPDSDQRIRASLDPLLDILDHTGCKLVNVPWGNRADQPQQARFDDIALDRLTYIADRVADRGGRVTLEMLNEHDNPRYRITDPESADEMMRRANARCSAGNVGLLLDIYHLAMSGIRPDVVIGTHRSTALHVQIADAPGRGRPGTGSIDFQKVREALGFIDYQGLIGMEYFVGD